MENEIGPAIEAEVKRYEAHAEQRRQFIDERRGGKTADEFHERFEAWRQRLGLLDCPLFVWVGAMQPEVLESVYLSQRTGVIELIFAKFEGEENDWDGVLEEEIVFALLSAWLLKMGFTQKLAQPSVKFGLYHLARLLVRFAGEQSGVAPEGDPFFEPWRWRELERDAFESVVDRERLLKFWQQTLGLRDWKIKLEWCPAKKLGPHCDGQVAMEINCRHAEVLICRTDNQHPDWVVEYDPEAILVQELLHLHTYFLGVKMGDEAEEAEEQFLEALTGAFIGIRRGE